MLLALVLGLTGLALSAFFSGTETGFYRATRLRLLLDAVSGDSIARGLSWLSNHPTFFVATTLVGNNLANYLTSLAIVLAAHHVVGQGHQLFEIVAPIALAPVLFIYGELLPKYLFFHAPNLLLRRTGPFFLIAAVAFAPVSSLLWLVSKLLERFSGASPQRVMSNLARRELQLVLDEGHEVGVLQRTQRQLAQSLFAVASRRVEQFARQPPRQLRARADMTNAQVLQLARRHRTPLVPVESTDDASQPWAGYVRVADLVLSTDEALVPIRPLLPIEGTASYLTALIRLHTEGEALGRVVDAHGKTLGLVSIDDLQEPLFGGGR